MPTRKSRACDHLPGKNLAAIVDLPASFASNESGAKKFKPRNTQPPYMYNRENGIAIAQVTTCNWTRIDRREAFHTFQRLTIVF